MKKPIVGLVENMAYIKCDECGHQINIYKSDETDNVAQKYGLDVVAKLPLDPELANDADEGLIENYQSGHLKELVEKL